MAKKIFALIPSERLIECNHSCGKHYTGRIPCTGQLVCNMCGEEVNHG